MNFTFEDAQPVITQVAEPNPFVDVVQSIAMKEDDNGRPVAKSFTVPYSTEAEIKEYGKAIRQLHAAGALVKPQVGVRKHVEDVKTSNRPDAKVKAKKVTFWTGAPISRPRKPVSAPPANVTPAAEIPAETPAETPANTATETPAETPAE